MTLSLSRSAGMLVVAAACAGIPQAKAQDKEAHRAGIFSLVVENDFVGHIDRHIFLDGNSFRDGPSVDKENWVGDLQGGIVLGWGNTQVTSFIWQTKSAST